MKNIEQREEIEFDLPRIIGIILKKTWIIVGAAVASALAAILITSFLITPEYQSRVLFYVNNKSVSVGSATFGITAGDISASKHLVDSYIVILKSGTTLREVIDHAELDCSVGELKRMLRASSVNSTEIFEVVVTSDSAQEAVKIADSVAEVLPARINSLVTGTSVKVVDSAVAASGPSSPSTRRNAVLGFLMGACAAVGIIGLQAILDIKIRKEEDVSDLTEVPVLASIPDLQKRSRYKHIGAGLSQKYQDDDGMEQNISVGEISGAVSEAFTFLRTKILFSFVENRACRVIGVSSALAGEGKSTVAVNLANAFAQLDRRVLLVDCDLRRPSIHKKLKLRCGHGLSHLLTNQTVLQNALYQVETKQGSLLWVVPVGQISPHPAELLSSAAMEQLIREASGSFDYIILDLPPVEEVSDALAAVKYTDGILLVVRENYCNRRVLKHAIAQFEYMQGKLLGIVMTCAAAKASENRKKDASYGTGKTHRRPVSVKKHLKRVAERRK